MSTDEKKCAVCEEGKDTFKERLQLLVGARSQEPESSSKSVGTALFNPEQLL